MIAQIFPKDFRRYLSLPVLGRLMNPFAAWLHGQHYTWRSSQFELRMAAHVCEYLQRRGIRDVEDVREQHMRACYRLFRRKFPNEAGSVRVLGRFLVEQGFMRTPAVTASSWAGVHLNAFRSHLRDARGYAPSTIQQQVDVAAELLDWLNFEGQPHRLSSLSIVHVEKFVRRLGKRLGRASLQKCIATLRKFFRFLATGRVIPVGLDHQIDTPRVYRQERLPRALPWPTVQVLLRSINRNRAIGKRDYAMFSLMATYGLRACDVVALTLDDIQWRAGCIRICQSKTGNPLELPLTPAVSSAIYDYLKNVPRYGKYRQVFLRIKAPGGILKGTAVTEAFQAWSRESGLKIPFQGAQCLRHSYALHLLRQGQSLKTIGDLLGHRSPESTAVYIRLATDDLREVALPVPAFTEGQKEGL
ncbi:MAG: site-specific integrase [Candidatus Sulfotelmatobacter sp.]